MTRQTNDRNEIRAGVERSNGRPAQIEREPEDRFTTFAEVSPMPKGETSSRRKASSAGRKTAASGGRKKSAHAKSRSGDRKKSTDGRKKSRGGGKKSSGSRKYGKKSQEKVHRAMHEMQEGTLRSRGSGKKVTNRKQAIAIGLSEARRGGAKVPPRRRSRKKGS